MSEDRVAFSLSFPARAEYIVLCRLGVTALERLAPLEEELVEDLKLAVTEACTNVVQHAYREGTPGRIGLTYEAQSEFVRITIEDTGVGHRNGLRHASGDREGGLGFAIIRSLVDELELGAGSGGRGTRVSLAKRR